MIVNLDYLKILRRNNLDKKIVLVLGSFDLLHFEHVSFLNDAKKLGDILVACVKDDKTVSEKGADRPVINEQQRLFLVDNCKAVDYSILANSYTSVDELSKKVDIDIEDNKNVQTWYRVFYKVFAALKPDILYHEENQIFDKPRLEMKKLFGTISISRKRTAIVSTTKIIEKIRKFN